MRGGFDAVPPHHSRYCITAAGINARAAEAGGIRPGRAQMGAMLFSGALAGLAGGMLVASSFGRLVEAVSVGYGFDGISIAVLGQYTAVGIFLSSVLFGALRTGSLYIEMFVGIPTEIVSVLQGVMIVVIASPLIFKLLFKSLDMVAGRGFISIAVFVFAKWNPIACLWVAMLFGFTEAIQMRLQVFELPSQIIQMIPYFSTLLVLASLHHTRKSGRAQQ